MFKLTAIIIAFLSAATSIIGQEKPASRQDELSLTLKIISGKIIYGADDVFVTEPNSIYLQPGLRYDYPLRTLSKQSKPSFFTLSGQTGFLFCKAKMLDPLIYKTRNPTYFVLSAGIFTTSVLSLGTELFYWKGLGFRDIWGLKFPALGYNGKSLRIYASAEHYRQLIRTGNKGTVFALEFCWKLIKGK